MGLLFRLYINALMKGNPIAVGITIVGAVALSLGPFKQGLTSGDPAAIGLVVFVIMGIVILLTLGIVDRRSETPRKKAKKKKRTGVEVRRLPSRDDSGAQH